MIVLSYIITLLLSGIQGTFAQLPYMTVTANPTLCQGQDTITIRAFPNCTGCLFNRFDTVMISGNQITPSNPLSNPTEVIIPGNLSLNSPCILKVRFRYDNAGGTPMSPALLDTLNILPKPVVTYPTLPLCNSPGLSVSPTNAPSGLLFSLSSGGLIIPSTGEIYPMGQVLPDTVHWVDSTLCHYSGEIPLTFQSPSVSSSWNYGLPHCVHNGSPILPNFIASAGTFSMNPVTSVVLDSMSGSIQTSPLAPPGIYPVTYTYPLSQCSLPSIALLELQNDSVAMVCPTDSFCEGSGWTLPPAIIFMPGIAAGGIFTSAGLNPTWMDSLTGAINTDSVLPGHYSLTYQTQGNSCNRTYSVAGEIFVIPRPDASFTYPNSVYCVGSGTATPSRLDTTGTFGYLPLTSNLAIDQNTGEINLAVSDTGYYTIWHKVASGNACTVTDSFDILLAALGSAVTVMTASPTYCRYDIIEMTMAGAPAGGVWAVSPPNGALFLEDSANTAKFLATGLGNLWISYAAPGNCAETGGDSVTVTVPDTSTFQYSPAPNTIPYCDNTDAVLVPLVNTTGMFSCDGLFTRNDSGFIRLSGTPAGAYIIEFDPDGCYYPAQYILQVHLHPDDSLEPLIEPDTLCEGANATFIANDDYRHTWIYNDDTILPVSDFYYQREDLAVGDALTILYRTTDDCVTRKDIALPIHPVPILLVDTTLGWVRRTGEPLVLEIQASEAMAEVAWSAVSWRGKLESNGDTLDSISGNLYLIDSDTQLTVHPTQGSLDTLMHLALSLVPSFQGCMGDPLLLNYIVIHREELAMHIPGVFTPDGDGFNDTWEITIPESQRLMYDGYRLLVFNRSGGLVDAIPFGADGPTVHWSADGLPAGVYQYILEDPSGKVQKHGGVTVLK